MRHSEVETDRRSTWLEEARERFNRFVSQHETAWELGMAGLAVAYVAIGFAEDAAAVPQPAIEVATLVLTWLFIGEFAIRISASRQRFRYLRDHLIDLVALIPIARGVRAFRLLRLLRLVRAFTGFRRAVLGVEQLANHHGFASIVIAWFGTMLLCSWAFLLAEGGTNPLVNDVGDAVWWGLMTLTGGSTRTEATTPEGHLITAILLVVGVALFTAITAILVSFFVATERKPTATDELRSLATMRADGLITEAEFDGAKASILSRYETRRARKPPAT